MLIHHLDLQDKTLYKPINIIHGWIASSVGLEKVTFYVNNIQAQGTLYNEKFHRKIRILVKGIWIVCLFNLLNELQI